MPNKKKKFIDKKNAVTFHLVHRSQRDPLQASEDASLGVLLSTNDKVKKEKQKEDQVKYGIFFEDEYNYLQHLKDTNEGYELEPVVDKFRLSSKVTEQKARIQLPSSVFPTEVETEVGLLNKAVTITGPQPNWDPDIVEALDDDFDMKDPDNILDDDFMLKANAPDDGTQFNDQDSGEDEEFGSDFGSDDFSDNEDGHMFMDEETKTQFTNYSISSSVMRRNEGLTLLDDRFEKLYEQYEDTEIGALDHEDIDGCKDSKVLDSILEEFEKEQEEKKFTEIKNCNSDVDVESGDDCDIVEMIIQAPKEKWDCESILSTYSNLYNHPKIITEPHTKKKIQLTSKLQIPKDSFEKPGMTRKQLEKEIHENLKADCASTYRPKDESLEEKRSRKQAVKQERKERRQEKKQNKEMFKSEMKRQEKEVLNLQNNLQGMKL
ncbi:protein LTV1 homolog isoform X1 [Mytilus edulis]|uniref:protein LTV1 homolog isoform X1 n=1 Tax=Mytilus edulis TaxID=6550 RepID=UPI0039F04B35